MEVIAKALVVAMTTVALLCGMYVGIRTAADPTWLVRWRNRLNGDPRDYPPEWRDQWWARWNAMVWDPDRVRESPFLSWGSRIGGIFLAVFCAILLVGLINYASER